MSGRQKQDFFGPSPVSINAIQPTRVLMPTSVTMQVYFAFATKHELNAMVGGVRDVTKQNPKTIKPFLRRSRRASSAPPAPTIL